MDKLDKILEQNNIEMETPKKKKRILLKLGSNTLTKETDHISRGKIEDIGRQIATLKDKYEFVIISSGAVAVAKQFVNLERSGENIDVKQALASIGQPHLMRIFQENFRELGLLIGQCLLSPNDFSNEESRQNIVNTVNVLIENDYIPIINENDTSSTDAIKFGDNDNLAAQTAALLDVDLFIIATNTHGVYKKGSIEAKTPETIRKVSDLDALKKEVMSETKSTHGTGGMSSKVSAAEITQKAKIETWIVNGLDDNFILNAIEDKVQFTRIHH
ncbi:glutamate 5-kinase [Salinimicrobium xinjiangense]|uniref:glutamate 5-kinase n=1 Tax=Salinimicrobium xinjiangense TaxID=438596 RepID=UPI0003FB1761|nr:glutamate 5-kinase [Salinimicrobium xinjiangense]